MLAVLAAAAAWNLKPGSDSSSTSIARLAMTLPAGDQLTIDGGTTIAISADGSKLAYAASRAGVSQIYVRTLDETDAKPIAGTEAAVGPIFSPDGQWIAFFQQGKLKKLPLSGGAPQVLTDVPSPRGADWGEDDSIYYTPGFNSGIWKVPAAGGSPVEVTKLDRSKGEVSHRSPQLLPGGKAILFTLWTSPEQDARSVYLQVLATGERRVLIRGADSGRYVATGHIVAARSGSLLALPFDLEKSVDLKQSSGPADGAGGWGDRRRQVFGLRFRHTGVCAGQLRGER